LIVGNLHGLAWFLVDEVIGGSNGEWKSRRSYKEPLAPRSVLRSVDENQIKEAFINGGRGHPPSHLKFFLLVFSKLKEDIK